jgi:hypothetical protein
VARGGTDGGGRRKWRLEADGEALARGSGVGAARIGGVEEAEPSRASEARSGGGDDRRRFGRRSGSLDGWQSEEVPRWTAWGLGRTRRPAMVRKQGGGAVGDGGGRRWHGGLTRMAKESGRHAAGRWAAVVARGGGQQQQWKVARRQVKDGRVNGPDRWE